MSSGRVTLRATTRGGAPLAPAASSSETSRARNAAVSSRNVTGTSPSPSTRIMPGSVEMLNGPSPLRPKMLRIHTFSTPLLGFRSNVHAIAEMNPGVPMPAMIITNANPWAGKLVRSTSQAAIMLITNANISEPRLNTIVLATSSQVRALANTSL
ncbi:hypothetical protein MAGR_29340 [Mycolicibacterium agri]|uniref:Uncharacterized protein n=1 Tax=Mycolicibacterium agri TaxID=36811 RepID=A0A7I9W1E7_MYCAG|nr:hypothetical protein MAGR_29340 [Mycolicibacterium agri]